MRTIRSLAVLLPGLAALGPGTTVAGSASLTETGEARGDRPNILWITCEDMGPHIGPYGDHYAVTPHLDRLAARSLRYRTVWSNAPVCAPARTALISGLFPPSTGSEHMRSLTRLPAGMPMYPQLLREAGYYCTNNSKEDYNLEKPGEVWDESSQAAHWKNHRPGQPFFAIFNLAVTHESGIRRRPHTLVHDPAQAPLPAYHPDAPEVRHDWAQYYDNITAMDAQVGARLKELEEAGLAGETIIFFYSDHGSGMPRDKRWPYNSGLQVPLLIHVPERFRHLAPRDYAPGGVTDRLVSFVDFAPTLCSLVGMRPPEHFHGRAFMGRYPAPAPRTLFGFRGRMDERYDLVRSVRDERYVYIRNYMPHRIYGQHVSYMFETPTTQAWRRLYEEGRLKPPQTHFWETKPAEELYDLQEDPHEVRNLAGSAAHREILERMRGALRAHLLQMRDVGFLPEGEIHTRSEGSTPYEMGHDDRKYPLRRILDTAEQAASSRMDLLPGLQEALKDTDSAVRYWAATGFLIRGREGVTAGRAELRAALADASPYVRITAAEALGKYGPAGDVEPALRVLGELAPPDRNGVFVSVAALNAIDELGRTAAPLLPLVKTLAQTAEARPGRTGGYVPRLVEKITADLEP